MAQPYIGEIRIFAGNFPPNGWMFCEGQLLPISENEALFQLIGTTYGGDGEETFALPDLRGRIPLHMGTGPDGTTYQIGEAAGVEEVTLTVQQIPAHSHPMLATSNNALSAPAQTNTLGSPTAIDTYRPVPPNVTLSPQTIGPTGGSQPHTNFMPYLCLDFIISLFGIYPQAS
jgi:microcystin-dependent protein